MAEVGIQELRAPYRHVVTEGAIRHAVRLLAASVEPRGENSVYLTRGERTKYRSILMLEGLGREVWQGVDPVKYVRELRDEW